jgi:Flp pilus assembly protein TadG
MRRQRGRRRSSGQSLVEFALVFPIFILVLAAIIDFGLGMYSYMTVINAVREGGRLAVTNCTGSASCLGAVQSRTYASSVGLLSGSSGTVTVACGTTPATIGDEACSASKAGDSVQVTANYTYRMIWPLTFGTQIPMTSTVTFMME